MVVTGFLHPGAMGASLAAACGGRLLWCGSGRSESTRERAEASGMEEVVTLAELAERSDVLVSVCPPGLAVDVADQVVEAGFDGLYVDVNAVAPATARAIAERFERFVDGGIIGPPVHGAGSTRLYLAGDEADAVAGLWHGSDLETRLVNGPAGAASAVKVCFAAWTKGTAALLLAVRALADAEMVGDVLLEEWASSIPELADQSELTALGNAPKAWRFAGEMEESADAFAAHGLPDGFSRAAAELYKRLAPLKDVPGADLAAVVDLLRTPLR